MDNSIIATVFTAKYSDEKIAKTDYSTIKRIYRNNDSLEDFNAAIIFKDKSNKIDVIIRAEELTLTDSWIGSIIGLTISILILFLLLPGYFTLDGVEKGLYSIVGVIMGTLLGTLIGAIVGHFNSGLHRNELNELAELLKIEEYGLIVISIDNMSVKIQEVIKKSNKVHQTEFTSTKKEINKIIKKIKKL